MAGKKQKKRTLAEKADRHVLYENAVQNVGAEIDFVDSTFAKLRERTARVLREDFCGTANTSCGWVRRRADNIAWGVDIDPDVLDWSRRNKLTELTPLQRGRVHLVNGDVLKADSGQVDVTLAMNFSYWIFKQRPLMKRYFRRVHRGLARDGIFFLDAYGGYESSREMEESTIYKGFTYVWDQASYNPINGDITCHIHFRFKDRSKIKNAFTYNWRLWTLPELQEMLEEAGFRPTVYWEGTDKHGEGNGVFTPATTGEADAGWIAYIVAEKKP
jgi:cyclopropane fatty-acyl-phospholipid synthase-like methyltransferase